MNEPDKKINSIYYKQHTFTFIDNLYGGEDRAEDREKLEQWYKERLVHLGKPQKLPEISLDKR